MGKGKKNRSKKQKSDGGFEVVPQDFGGAAEPGDVQKKRGEPKAASAKVS